MPMTLMNYVTNKAGAWASSKQVANDNVIELTHADDGVTMQGPLSLNVSFVAEAVFSPVSGNGSQARTSTNDLYSYNLEVPAGYTWRYQMSDAPTDSRLMSGFKVIIRQSPCSRPPATQAPDLPCDFAVGNQPCIGDFFPVGCEPCGNGPVRMPPVACGPSLAVTPASGGCIRPRFFNGMFITREDLETELRYFRVKNKLERKTIGQGVVWGLGVGRDGRSIVVKPGYAIDCCGNDLTVTSNYSVDQQTLLSDPAICNLLNQGQQRFNLLLEYVECPEQPRPVHGDPCVGSASACEMSRVRETVRLRLVPPRDYKPNGPITKFLNTIAPTNAGGSNNTSSPSSGTTLLTAMPFNITVTALSGPAATIGPVSIPLNSTSTFQQSGTIQVLITELEGFGSFAITLTPTGGFSFQATVAVTSGTTSQPGDGSVLWNLPSNLAENGTVATGTATWNGTQPSGAETLTITGTTTIGLTWNAVESDSAKPTPPSGTTTSSPTVPRITPPFAVLNVNLTLNSSTNATASLTATPFPCLTDPCCPAGTKQLFPVTPPWADANPFNPTEAADLRVLEMAFFYALAVGYSTQQDGQDALRALVSYGTVLKSLEQTQTPINAATVLIATEQLLSDWCCSFLYPGPSCQGDPHGVVIGCVTVNSDGNISRIDPWSGRRWVVTYPLLSYWGEQIGIVPPDLLASKLFSVVCCLAGLVNTLHTEVGLTKMVSDALVQEVPLGAGTLRVGPQLAPKAQNGVLQPPTRTTSVSLTTFAAKVLAALARSSPPAGTPMVDVTLAGYPDVHLIVPDDTATPAPTPDRTTSLVRDALAVRELRTAIPPLLRGFAESLAVGLTSAVPVSVLAPAAPIVAPLTTAGIKTVGDVLSRTPDSIYVSVLGKTQAPALSDLVTRAEATADTVAKNVVDALKQTAGARTLVSTDDLASADTRKAFVQALATQTKLPEGTVDASVTSALK
jgi:hypothetical protein